MPAAELSDEQAKVLLAATRVTEAGPGSGKTRALVQRYLQTAETTTRGVALLSFTNSAVNEVRRRAGSSPRFLRAPHFVGTIDSFLHRFIVTPAEVSRLGRLPVYRASWGDLASEFTDVRLGSLPGAGLPLSAFRLSQPNVVVLSEKTLSWEEHGYLTQVDNADLRQQLMNLARSKILGFNNVGIYDANTARVKAFSLLNDANGDAIVSRLTKRFSSLLVDEAQDCDEAEMGIIRRLSMGLSVTIVADPDQAIYEFRGSKPELFIAYRDEQDDNHRCHLSTNYRSTRSICMTVDSLRAAGGSPIVAADNGACSEVLVLCGTPTEQHQKFLNALDEQGIDHADAVVLAHSLADAAAVTGSAAPERASTAAGNRLAGAIHVLTTDPSPDRRLDAVQRIERIILSLIIWEDDVRKAGRERQLEVLTQRPDWLRLAAGTVVSRLKSVDNRDQFGVTARTVLSEILDPLTLEHAVLGNRVKKPDAAVWTRCSAANAAQPVIRSSTVHAAKGAEFKAVLVALPNVLRSLDDRTVLDDWDGGFNTEPRRVLYVAASRAESLLAFGAGPHQSRIAALLATAGIPTECR
jgi:DNA helicase-2/ATP-dependent DNA helicase PcrA